MPLSWTERLARLDTQARAAGYENYNQRRNETRWFRTHGLSLSDRSVQRAVQEFARFYARDSGLAPGDLNRRSTMQAFRAEASRRRLDHSWNDEPITALLEDRGIVDLEDGGWDEFWDRDTPGGDE